MPSEVFIARGCVPEGTNGYACHHLQTADGTELVQGDINGSGGAEIAITLYDLDSTTPTTATLDTTADKAAVVFDTLQTDGYWDSIDGTGYNFRYTVPAANLANGGHRYRCEFSCSTSSFGTMRWVTIIDVIPLTAT